MKILGLIPARGGSKGIPRKNLRELAGRPLIAHTIAVAKACGALNQIVVSTEDSEIARVAEESGARVPFIRPAELALDETPTLPVVLHAIDALREPFDAVCLLQPTQPFRESEDIEEAVKALENDPAATSVISVSEVPAEFHPNWVYRVEGGGYLRLYSGATQPPPRRQDLAPAYYRNGSIYLTKTQTLQRGSLYGSKALAFFTDPGVNLDTEDDWRAAVARLSGSSAPQT